jgi:hypothetical protein
MIEAVLWMAIGAVLVLAVLITYSAVIGLLNDEDKHRRDEKHRNHHKWNR